VKRWWQPLTLRSRLAVWYGLGGTVLLAGFSATLYLYVAREMAQPLGYQLHRDFAVVKERLTVQPDGRILWDGRPWGMRAQWSTEYPWFELWDENGRLLRRFWPFAEHRTPQVPVAPAYGRETISVFNVAPDLRIRSLAMPFEVPGQEAAWMIRLMRVHVPAANPLGALGLIIVVTLPIVVSMLVVGGYVITRRWLTPLDRMVDEANRITAENFSRRLPVVNRDDELGRLATVFNETLDRLESSFDALDRFVADASHELRTPLTTLRSVGEVGLRRSRTAGEYREIIGSMLEESQRLQLLIQRLLELASAEGGAPQIHRTEVQLDEFVRAGVSELGILAEARAQNVTVQAGPSRTMTDPVLLRQALQNLIDNAIKYSPPNSTIRVAVREWSDRIDISISDEGPGISAENREHLTKRFFRPDRARGRESGGFGLGLSITKAYMRVLGGSLEYEPGVPSGSIFRLVLPRLPAD
jgi:two-component system, OmpR family, sensor kinase